MSKPTPIVTLAIAAVLALSALSPASAATRQKRTVAAAAQSEPMELAATPRARPDWSPIPTPAWQMPNACVSDEGYGRYSSCDSGESN
jgi:hypothetical protein